MTETLIYPNTGKPMLREPRNVDWAQLVSRTQTGLATFVELEPGDATYYALLIAPVPRTELRRFGLGSINWWFVAQLDDEGARGSAWVRTDMSRVDAITIATLSSNQWSRILLAWWLTELVRAVHA